LPSNLTVFHSKAGALMVKMLAAVADFERGLINERTQAGLARARLKGNGWDDQRRPPRPSVPK